jgi:hypothetical protein
MDTIDDTLKVLRWALSYVFIAIDLFIILLYLSVLNGHLVDLNAPLVTLLLLLSVVWWTCLISCQFINYPKKYISTSLIP